MEVKGGFIRTLSLAELGNEKTFCRTQWHAFSFSSLAKKKPFSFLS